MICRYNGALFSFKKRWNSDACYNVDEAWKFNAKWKKPNTNGQIQYDPTLY